MTQYTKAFPPWAWRAGRAVVPERQPSGAEFPAVTHRHRRCECETLPVTKLHLQRVVFPTGRGSSGKLRDLSSLYRYLRMHATLVLRKKARMTAFI